MAILVLVGFCGLLLLGSRRSEKRSRPFGLWAILVFSFSSGLSVVGLFGWLHLLREVPGIPLIYTGSNLHVGL
jgi:hypothetical protein